MHRYKLIVEYDGTPFFGWQRQEGYITVQQRLDEAILPMTKTLVTMHGAGRTDRGVHAFGQVAHFDTDKNLNAFRIQECMNAYLVDVPISVLDVCEVDDSFNARFSAVERSYVYKIVNRRAKLGLDENRAWKVIKEIDISRMKEAAALLIGKHDFSSFRAAGCQSKSPIKTLNSIDIDRVNDQIFVTVRAKSFLYHQVRNIVGSLVQVGVGDWSVDYFKEVFESRDRTRAAVTAPACGLYFNNVKY